MKTLEEIKAKKQNYLDMLDREECQDEVNQIKIYSYLHILEWLLK